MANLFKRNSSGKKKNEKPHLYKKHFFVERNKENIEGTNKKCGIIWSSIRYRFNIIRKYVAIYTLPFDCIGQKKFAIIFKELLN